MERMSEMEFSPNIKKHKKHKSEKRDRDGSEDKPQGLKLILKVGSQTTPEHNPAEWAYQGFPDEMMRSHHKKSKKKKKKKDKNKDREKKHKHHHKEKKRKREDATEEVVEEIKDEKEEIQSELGSPSQREPRTCVLRKIHERSPLQRMLDHLHKAVEKRDPNQFFAWPVTDNIAPGYSSIITRPMDLSSMRQKIDDNLYGDLQDFIADFKLMCTNAMEYNHAETVYYKASKKLLHAGLKLFQPEKMGWLLQLIPELTNKDFGFEIPPELRQGMHHQEHHDDDTAIPAKRRMPATKFEAVPDDLEPDEILARAQASAREARAKLAMKGVGPNMGFIRQNSDGTTHLNILVGGDGVIPGTKKRPVLLGTLTGKLTEGTGQIQGFREDRRNVAKPVKPLYYGAFGSYAPSYDSAFSNLTKEESDLVFQTYGSDTAVQYAESILDFAKENDYATHLADSLLDILTGNEHSKTKKVIDEHKRLREEEEAVKVVLEAKPQQNVNIKLDDLKSLANDGIDVQFLSEMESDIKTLETQQELQLKLDSMSQLLDKLHKVQYQRLSQPLPHHLSQVPNASEEELTIAENITDNLTDIAKKVNPTDITPVAGVRKALGVAVENDNDVSELELELRQYLECETSLCPSPLKNDNSLEDILME